MLTVEGFPSGVEVDTEITAEAPFMDIGFNAISVTDMVFSQKVFAEGPTPLDHLGIGP